MISHRLSFAVAALAFTVFLAGCGPAAVDAPEDLGEVPQQASRDHLEVASEFLDRFDEFEPGLVSQPILYHLNRWLADERGAEWKPDPLLARLPSQFRDHESLQLLNHTRFELSDLAYLHAFAAFRRLNTWVPAEPLHDKLTAEWLAGPAREEYGVETTEQLSKAALLFDWTIRNIQLEASPEAQQASIGPERPGGAEGETKLLDGPGLRRDYWLTLMTGRGDAWERGRVFIALCRQAGIDALVLAVDDGRRGGPGPWCVAVALEGRLFLFDPSLGLPLEGETAGSIATLTEIREKPELLRAHDAGEFTYPIRSADLARLALLVDADPSALSWRMQRLAAALTGENRLALAAAPSETAERLKKSGIELPVQVWTVPLEAVSRRRQVLENPAERANFIAEQFWFLERTPLSQARWLHLGGRFDDESRPGAVSRYLQSRVPEEAIRGLTYQDFQQTFGGQLENTAEEVQRKAFEAYKDSIRRTKMHASYWLGLLQFEKGQFEVAADWFRDRTLASGGENPWLGGARYNLGRAHEQLGDWSRARQLYLADESPQAHGNHLRAKRLRPLAEAAAGEQTPVEPETPAESEPPADPAEAS